MNKECRPLTNREDARISYALRRVPEASIATILPCPERPQLGDVVLARLEKKGKNSSLELVSGRRCTLHENDALAVVFGNRYATRQFEGYVGSDGDRCDLLSMGGLCGLVESRHAAVTEPTRLRLLGALGDADGRPLRLRDYALPPLPASGVRRPRIITVCGTSMDVGKTYTLMSLIIGLRRSGLRVASIKLTGTATGTDRWNMLDAGACMALDFIDGGLPATYLCSLDELLAVYEALISHATTAGADYVVVEIADGLLQRETEALLQSSRFTTTVDAWMLATSDPLGAVGGATILRNWGIEPLAISGQVSMSPLCIREVTTATGIPCLTAQQLQCGEALRQHLMTAEPVLR